MTEDRTHSRAADGPKSGKLAGLLQTLPAELRPGLEGIWTEDCHAPGDVVLREDHDNGRIGYVVEGFLGMVKQLPDGRRHIIGLLGRGDMFGRAFDGTSGYRIEALAETLVLTCDRARFKAVIGRSAEAEHLFLTEMQDELDAAREWVVVLGGRKIVQRLASFLFILCRRKRRAAGPGDEDEEEMPINLRISIRRRDLAQYLGARPESLSRALRELEQDGVIRINDPYDLDVLSLQGLLDAAGQDLALDE